MEAHYPGFAPFANKVHAELRSIEQPGFLPTKVPLPEGEYDTGYCHTHGLKSRDALLLTEQAMGRATFPGDWQGDTSAVGATATSLPINFRHPQPRFADYGTSVKHPALCR